MLADRAAELALRRRNSAVLDQFFDAPLDEQLDRSMPRVLRILQRCSVPTVLVEMEIIIVKQNRQKKFFHLNIQIYANN